MAHHVDDHDKCDHMAFELLKERLAGFGSRQPDPTELDAMIDNCFCVADCFLVRAEVHAEKCHAEAEAKKEAEADKKDDEVAKKLQDRADAEAEAKRKAAEAAARKDVPPHATTPTTNPRAR